MISRAPNLLSPFKFASGITVKNRVAMAPMTRARAGPSRVSNELMAEYYKQRASGGLLISEGTTISPQAEGYTQTPGIYTPEMVDGWKKVTTTVKAAGGVMAAQLWHTGRQSHSSFQPGNQLPVAPSAIASQGKGNYDSSGKIAPHEVPHALELDEIAGVVNDYQTAARNALEAGFDMVEFHGANGYILDEFLQSCSNHRTDAYGGSIEKRFRFVREVVEAVCDVVPANRVGIRLSPNGSIGGMGSEDNIEAFTYAAQELNKIGIGFIHVMDGDGMGFHGLTRRMTLLDFRRVYDGAIIANIDYSRDTAEGVIRAGAADLVAFGRPYIPNPDLVARFENDWPLAEADPATTYSHEAAGYTDYPAYQQAAKPTA